MPKRRSTFQPRPEYTPVDLIVATLFCALVAVTCIAAIVWMALR